MNNSSPLKTSISEHLLTRHRVQYSEGVLVAISRAHGEKQAKRARRRK